MPRLRRDKSLDRWHLLRARYQSRGLVLALGAGVSAGCGLPNWPELLLRVGECCLPERHGRDLVQRLIDTGATLPAIAGVLESKAPRGKPFSDVLREQLYRDFPFHHAIVTRKHRRALVDFVHDQSPTMRAVTALCVHRDTPDGEFLPNPRIRAVVNFNLDAVLRAYAAARYEAYLFRTIERADKPQRIGRIPIYHMHGLLKFDRTRRADETHEIRSVFTEGEYFDVFNQPHSVFNYTFLYLLREYNCLFVGLSMNDENIRRLLHYSTSERRQHLRESAAHPRAALRHFAVLRRTGSLDVDALIDTSLRRLGTRVLWIDQFEDLPARLAYVYDAKAWSKVY
ncbi:MAG TPA: SIR2 family protein [Opitutus sp.]|nr:SIR2 family protein [Opitutus sp.]